jgi:hypothetical protein
MMTSSLEASTSFPGLSARFNALHEYSPQGVEPSAYLHQVVILKHFPIAASKGSMVIYDCAGIQRLIFGFSGSFNPWLVSFEQIFPVSSSKLT